MPLLLFFSLCQADAGKALKMAKDKRRQGLAKIWRKTNPCTLGGNVIGATGTENSIEFPKKTKN